MAELNKQFLVKLILDINLNRQYYTLLRDAA